MSGLHRALADARLYFVTGAGLPLDLLASVLDAGVGVLQLRM
jgi:hypothetical protein